MTLALGMVDGDRAILCVDSGVWDSGGVTTGSVPKIWRSGPFVMSMAGAISQMRIARTLDVVGECPHEHVDRVIDAIAKREETVSKLSKDGPVCFGIAIACGNRVLDCGSDGGLSQPAHGIVAVGGGSDFAHGAAVSLRASGIGTLSTMRMAMQHAREFTTSCRWPVRWIATDGTEGVWE